MGGLTGRTVVAWSYLGVSVSLVMHWVKDQHVAMHYTAHLGNAMRRCGMLPCLQARLGLHGERSREEVESEVRDIYTRLMTLDPMRKGYYQDALEGKAFVVVSALGTV